MDARHKKTAVSSGFIDLSGFPRKSIWCQKRTRIELCFTCYNSGIVDEVFRKGPQKGPQINVI
jgi:hypothetical protein